MIPSSTPFLLPRLRTRRSAFTLAATMLVVAAIATFLSLAALLTSQFGRYAGREQGTGMESAFADAALEYAYALWKTKVNTTVNNSGGSLVPAGSVINPTAAQISDFLANTFPHASQLGIDTTLPAAGGVFTLTITAVDQNGQNNQTLVTSSPATVESTASDVCQSTGVPPSVPTKSVPNYPGWTGYNYNYMAQVTFRSTNYGTTVGESYQARRYFQVTRLPLCQGLGFYEGNMEIHPGATMILAGQIHSNQNIWAQGYGAYLEFKNNISYVGTYHDGTSNPSVTKGWDGSNTGANNPDPYAPYFPNLYSDGLPKSASPYAQPVPGGSTVNPASGASSVYATTVNQVGAIDPFGGANTSNNGLHDIVQIPVNNTSNQIAYNNASLFVQVNSALINPLLPNVIPPAAISISVGDGAGNFTAVAPGSTDYNNVMAAINNGTTTAVYDKREGSNAIMTNLDMNLLNTATTLPVSGTTTPLQTAFNRAGTHGGTVYIHDIAPKTPLSEPSIRLINGRNLGENVSVASDNGVYIQGDYNTGGTVYTDVPTNQSTATAASYPQVSTYNRYASSVMADAVTVLSNGWADKNAGTALSTRNALPTTVNVAILAGDVASNTGGNGIASGGLHNFPRFLENWNNVNFTYYGSLIEAFNSAQHTGNWQTNDVYHWPNRLWNFDTNFLTNQPPGMPQGVIYSRGRWERLYVTPNANQG